MIALGVRIILINTGSCARIVEIANIAACFAIAKRYARIVVTGCRMICKMMAISIIILFGFSDTIKHKEKVKNMHVANKAIEEMLKNADPQSRKVMANILTGRVVARIYCLSEDITGTREVPVLDEKGEPVLYKTGKNKGQPKTTTETYIQREGCKGRLIGEIYDNGRAESIADENGDHWLRATRKRLDGAIGCECWCGQDSRISAQEAGDLKFDGQPPTKQGLESIFKKIEKNPTVVEIKNGRAVCDGFAFEELR